MKFSEVFACLLALSILFSVYPAFAPFGIGEFTGRITSSLYPDLVVTEIDITPGPSDDVFFTAHIKNQGPVSTADWGPFDVSWWIDSDYMDEVPIDEIGPGETIYRNTHWADATPGPHTVKFCVDYWDFIPESDETNNCREEDFYVEPTCKCPDLVVTKIDITYGTNCDVFITAHIKNQGCVSTAAWGSFDVSYWIDDEYLGELGIDVIDSGITIYRTWHWYGDDGWHTVKVCVDYWDFIPECDETNNCREEQFEIPCPDLVVTDVELPYTHLRLYANVTYDIGVNVTNLGSSSAGSFYVSLELFWVKGGVVDYYAEKSVTGLGPGESRIIPFSVEITHCGAYLLNATADCHDEVAESDETNNSMAIDLEGRLAGDLDGDGDVDFDDIVAIAMSYGCKCGDPCYNEQADLDADCDVDFDDVVKAAMNYGRKCDP